MQARQLGIFLIALGPCAASAQDAASDPVAEYENLLRETRGLELFNALLERQIAAQQQELVSVQAAIEDVPNLQTQLPPLMIRMVDGLDQFVERDVPFLKGERNARIQGLYEIIENTEASDAVKLRRILEAWSIEVEYGSAYHTFREEPANLPPALPAEIGGREIDFIALGRVGLIFQTTDEEALTGAWDYRNNTWVILESEYRNPIRQALRMARNQIAPELVLLPTVPPQVN